MCREQSPIQIPVGTVQVVENVFGFGHYILQFVIRYKWHICVEDRDGFFSSNALSAESPDTCDLNYPCKIKPQLQLTANRVKIALAKQQ